MPSMERSFQDNVHDDKQESAIALAKHLRAFKIHAAQVDELALRSLFGRRNIDALARSELIRLCRSMIDLQKTLAHAGTDPEALELAKECLRELPNLETASLFIETVAGPMTDMNLLDALRAMVAAARALALLEGRESQLGTVEEFDTAEKREYASEQLNRLYRLSH